MIVHVRQGRDPDGHVVVRTKNTAQAPTTSAISTNTVTPTMRARVCHPLTAAVPWTYRLLHAGDERAGRRMSTAGPRPVRASAHPPAMSHRSTPERIDQARRAATRSRLIGERVTEETAASCGWSGRVVASHPHPTGRRVHHSMLLPSRQQARGPDRAPGWRRQERTPGGEHRGSEAPPYPWKRTTRPCVRRPALQRPCVGLTVQAFPVPRLVRRCREVPTPRTARGERGGVGTSLPTTNEDAGALGKSSNRPLHVDRLLVAPSRHLPHALTSVSGDTAAGRPSGSDPHHRAR
jgi:hypothetical protein